jgi:hypothetical protein
MRCGLLDQITTPASQNLLEPGVAWCADNGIYSRAYPGDTQYLRWLSTLADSALCRFAVAPDVVADHGATLERSWPMLRRIRGLGLPVALCAQNGAEADDLPWDYLDAVFLAGIVECAPCRWVPQVEDLPVDRCPMGHEVGEWKEGAAAAGIAAEAKRLGKWIHMGRVNTQARMMIAKRMGCDSADGTFLTYGPDVNLPRLLSWLCDIPGQMPTPVNQSHEQFTLMDI